MQAIRTRVVALNYISQPSDVTRESVPTGTGYRKQMRKRDDQSPSPKSMILHNCINPQRKVFKFIFCFLYNAFFTACWYRCHPPTIVSLMFISDIYLVWVSDEEWKTNRKRQPQPHLATQLHSCPSLAAPGSITCCTWMVTLLAAPGRTTCCAW